MTDFAISGGCECGAVRYSVHGPARETYHCHCTICQKLHGAVFGTYSNLPREQLTIDKGADNLTTYDSSPDTHKQFCRTCGCLLFAIVDADPQFMWYTSATLDGGANPGHPPETLRHIFVRSKIPWYEITDDLPQFPEF